MPKEIETKFKIASANVLKRKLKNIGAVFVSKGLERDIYYNSPCGYFSPSGGVIRLRSCGNKCVFTVKKPVGGRRPRIYKICDELEVGIDDADTFNDILIKLGFVPCFRKEKIRETYRWKEAKILVDRLPYLGYYAEIEAPRKRIKELAYLLGFNMDNGISGTYLELFNSYKEFYGKRKVELRFARKRRGGR